MTAGDNPIEVLAGYIVDQAPALLADDPDLSPAEIAEGLRLHRGKILAALTRALRELLGAPAPAAPLPDPAAHDPDPVAEREPPTPERVTGRKTPSDVGAVALNRAAQTTMEALIKGLGVGESRTINTSRSFMPVYVARDGQSRYVVAHFYEQNGDLMSDPRLEFYQDKGGRFYPLNFEQHGMSDYPMREGMVVQGGYVTAFDRKEQVGTAAFVNDLWFKNIREQQHRFFETGQTALPEEGAPPPPAAPAGPPPGAQALADEIRADLGKDEDLRKIARAHSAAVLRERLPAAVEAWIAPRRDYAVKEGKDTAALDYWRPRAAELAEAMAADLYRGYMGPAHWRLDPDGTVWADTAFMNTLRDVPLVEMKHIGFGDFDAVTPWGTVSFSRFDDEPIPGKSGRAHKLYGKPPGAERRLLEAWQAVHPEYMPMAEPAAAPVPSPAGPRDSRIIVSHVGDGRPAEPPSAAAAEPAPPAPVAGPGEFPPFPPLVPVELGIDSYGSAKNKHAPGNVSVYKFSRSAEGLEALLKREGWTVYPSTGSYLHAAAPGGRPLGARTIYLRAMAPDREAFLAWADAVHAYYQRHPDQLRRGARNEDAPFITGEAYPGHFWRYEAPHSYEYTLTMRSPFGGEASRQTHSSQSGASLAWALPGAQLERTWPYGGGTPDLVLGRSARVVYKTTPATPAQPARDPAPTTGGAPGPRYFGSARVILEEIDGYLTVESPKNRGFIDVAHRLGARWGRPTRDRWNFRPDQRAEVLAGLERAYGQERA